MRVSGNGGHDRGGVFFFWHGLTFMGMLHVQFCVSRRKYGIHGYEHVKTRLVVGIWRTMVVEVQYFASC